MELVDRKRIEIVAEAALFRRILRAVNDLEVTGYTVLPVKGGRGPAGEWSRSGQVSAIHEMSMLVCLTSDDRAGKVLDAILPLLENGRGVVNVADVKVARGDKF